MLKIDVCFDITKYFKNVNQSKFYAITVDEVTDVSNHEQLVICICWIDHNFEPHEDMIGFYRVEDIKF